MTAKRDPELVKLETAEREAGLRRAARTRESQGTLAPSSATDKLDVVRARWVDTDRTHAWLKCPWCGIRHVLGASLVPSVRHFECSAPDSVFVEIADGDFERFCAEQAMDPVAQRRGRRPR